MSRSADDTSAEIEIEVEIEHAGITILARSGGRYRLEDSLGSGPVLKLSGREVAETEMGGWHAISAEKVAGGYLVAWKHDASGLFSAWRTDDQGNYTGNAIGAVRGDDDGFREIEDRLGHDLNDDRVIGVPHREIEHAGGTHLWQHGSRYELDDSLGNGPILKLNGRDVVEAEMGGWHAISAEKVAGGYLVAWKHDASGLYSAWRTDDQGNYTGNAIGAVRGDDDGLRHLEDSLGHDLNDDRVVGLPHREIEAAGRIHLTQVGGHYELDDSLGNGPTLKLNGRDALESEMGGWHAISAEKTSGGYLVAWKHDASGLYSAWRTDDQGNYTGNAIGAVRGDDDRFRHLEDDFGHDLNDDRVTGGQHREIEHGGTIHLTQIGARFYFSDDLSQGETLKLRGDDVLEGQLGGWHAIGAERTATGFQVAWKDDASGLYSVWNTDDHGNYTGNAIGAVRGDDDSFEAFETRFGQDLNGDRHDGVWHG